MSAHGDLTDAVVRAIGPYDIPTGSGWNPADKREPAEVSLAAVQAFLSERGLILTADGLATVISDRATSHPLTGEMCTSVVLSPVEGP